MWVPTPSPSLVQPPPPCHGVWEDIQDSSQVSRQMVRDLPLPQPGSSRDWLEAGPCLVSEVCTDLLSFPTCWRDTAG